MSSTGNQVYGNYLQNSTYLSVLTGFVENGILPTEFKCLLALERKDTRTASSNEAIWFAAEIFWLGYVDLRSLPLFGMKGLILVTLNLDSAILYIRSSVSKLRQCQNLSRKKTAITCNRNLKELVEDQEIVRHCLRTYVVIGLLTYQTRILIISRFVNYGASR